MHRVSRSGDEVGDAMVRESSPQTKYLAEKANSLRTGDVLIISHIDVVAGVGGGGFGSRGRSAAGMLITWPWLSSSLGDC